MDDAVTGGAARVTGGAARVIGGAARVIGGAARMIRGLKISCEPIYIAVILFIFAYGYIIRKMKAKDHLATPIASHPLCQDIDGWSISHLVFFGILGVLYPCNHLQFLLIGAGWEVIETMLGQNKFSVSGTRVQLIGDQDESGNLTGDDSAYWYGKESDILVDILGYSIGSAWAEKYWPNTG